MYKLSQYNVIFKRGNSNYLLNTFSSALIKLTKDGFTYISNFDNERDFNSIYFKLLYSNGCIVNKDIDE